jgi:hypothetical protein
MGVDLREVVVPGYCVPSLVVAHSYMQVGQCLWTLLAALLGGVFAHSFFVCPPGRDEGRESDSTSMDQPPCDRWIPPMIAAIVALVPLTSIAAIGSRSNTVFWAGATVLLTCALIGLAVLGAVLRRGRHRVVWVGAALFGAGCLVPVLAHPADSPFLSDRLLNGLRPFLAPIARSINPANARILEALDRPIPMRFPDETPLGEWLKYIGAATSTRSDPGGIPIYVDLIGLQKADRYVNPTLRIDIEGVPLRTTLRLGLTQFGLDYVLEDGYLRITCEEQVTASDFQDPFLIVGHCLLSLVAAGFGSIVAPFVAGTCRKPGPEVL